jgi:primosomal protein N' (replication factor Y)
MVTKGLDFDHVSLVGIINADQLIHHPGFRSHERAFQLMMQVAGRAGRKNKKGKVVVQTSDPAHPVIYNVLNSDFKRMYKTEIGMRRQFQYPPFARVIEIRLKHPKVQIIEKAALYLANEMRKTETGKVLGPATPFVSKINNFYIREVLVKSSLDSKQLAETKHALQQVLDKMKALPELKSVSVHVDVDP